MKTFEQKLDEQLQEIRRFLIEKNKKYGSSALEPIRIFSKCDKIEAIKVRIDDKLSRIKLGNIEDDANSDSIIDTLGYLLILKIAIRESEN